MTRRRSSSNKAAESTTAELRQSLQKEHDRAEALASELGEGAAGHRDATGAVEQGGRRGGAAQATKAAESTTAELRQSLQKEHDRAEALAERACEGAAGHRDAGGAVEQGGRRGGAAQARPPKVRRRSCDSRCRRSTTGPRHCRASLRGRSGTSRRSWRFRARRATRRRSSKQAAESATAELRQSLQKEYDRAEALTSELARARRDIETQVALASKAAGEAAQVKQAAESATAELRQSLQKEHERAEALTSELARAQRDIETQVALASKAGDEAAQLKQLKEAAESTTAELRQSLQKERNRAEALAPRREPTQPTIGARIEVEPASNSQIAQATQAAEAAATEQPAAAEAQGSPEAARLLARASALISQGNIGAARIVLERAVETGSAQASFMLAETYDPLVLSTWKTYGTRGDVTKARELYAKALAGGIQEAKDRSVALR